MNHAPEPSMTTDTHPAHRQPKRPRWLARHGGAALLALAVLSFWLLPVIAPTLAPGQPDPAVVDGALLQGATRLRIEKADQGYVFIKARYEQRDNIGYEWTSPDMRAPVWTREGTELVMRVTGSPAQIELTLPPWLSTLEAPRIHLSNTAGSRIEQLNLITGEGSVEGAFQRLDLTLGAPPCPKQPGEDESERYRYQDTTNIETRGTEEIVVRAASGRLDIENTSGLRRLDITAMPGVGLSLADIGTLSITTVHPMGEGAATSVHWAPADCSSH